MTDKQPDILAIFTQAVACETPQQREEFLAHACGDDSVIRQRVDQLLKAHFDVGNFLGGDAGEPGPTVDQPTTEQPGTQIGPYKLLQQLGEGGMGVVYMAEQKEPVKRRVAVKVIKPGMDTQQVIARFEAERQALAMMDHPNIAKVLDAGATENGRPYFVMELVNGLPVTKYCDEQHLTPNQRLELFLPICQAIQHAHQKGIIHRDLKPGNILVALYDGKPVPKIIDFGVAKAMSQTLTDKTMFTALGQIVGTLEYMSPEQAERNQLDIDTRSDIYSLGVVLYELLTGEMPFNRQRLCSAALDEMLRIIREEEPSKPSTKVSSSESLPSIAANRRTEPARLGNMIRGELDWIIMKAMEKDRDRRYETANGFGKDIERYLADEPVTASPPSRAYRFAKLVKRNKAAFTTAAVVFVALLFGIAGTTWGLRAASHANRELAATNASLDDALTDAKQQRLRAEENEATAVDETKRAERQLLRATEVKRLLAEMFHGVTPEKARGADITLLQGILDDAAARLERGEVKDELVAAELHRVVGEAYSRITLFPEAERHLLQAGEIYQRLLGADNYLTRWARWALGLHYNNSRQPDKAEPIFESNLKWSQATLGDEHPDTLKTMTNLARSYTAQLKYDKAVQLLEDTLEIKKRVLGLKNRDTLACMNNLASAYWSLERYADAEPIFEKVAATRERKFGADHPETLSAKINLANTYRMRRQQQQAEQLYKQTLPLARTVLGKDHPHLLDGLSNFAELLTQQSRFVQALPLEREVLEARKRIFPRESKEVAASMQALGRVYYELGRYADAEPLYDEALEIRSRLYDKDHRAVIATMSDLATLYREQQRYHEAESLIEDVLEKKRRLLGKDDPGVAATLNTLGTVYEEQGRKRKAESLYKKALEIEVKEFGKEHPHTLNTLNNLASLQKDFGKYDEAESKLLEVIEIRRRIQGPSHKMTLAAVTNLGNTYLAMERYQDAARMFETSLPVKRRILGPQHPWTAIALVGLAKAYLKLGRDDEAMPFLRELLELNISVVERRDAKPVELNNVAWLLLTHEFEELRDPQRALGLAERACAAEESAGGSNLAGYLDTLALAQHLTGDTTAAVETQRRALSLMSGELDPEMAERLAEFEAALASTVEKSPSEAADDDGTDRESDKAQPTTEKNDNSDSDG